MKEEKRNKSVLEIEEESNYFSKKKRRKKRALLYFVDQIEHFHINPGGYVTVRLKTNLFLAVIVYFHLLRI